MQSSGHRSGRCLTVFARISVPSWTGTTRSTPSSRTRRASARVHSTGSYLGCGVRSVFVTCEEYRVMGKGTESELSTVCSAAPISRAG